MTESSTSKSSSLSEKSTVFGLVIGVILAVLAVMLLPTTIIIVIGLIPSAVAFFVDSSRERLLGSTVFALNLAGVFPAILRLWKSGHHMDNAIAIITQPSVLMMILVPSGIGWLLYIYTPHFVSKIIRKRAEGRMRSLEKSQKELIEQWSPSVTGGVPLNSDEPQEKPKPESTEGSVTA